MRLPHLLRSVSLLALGSLCLASTGACGKKAGGGGGPDAEVASTSKLRPEKLGDIKGCKDSLTGEWHAKADPRYRYRFEDHGHVIKVFALLAEVPDGGHPSDNYIYEIERYPFADTSKPRWPTGKLRFHAEAPAAAGVRKSCEIELGARITGCLGRQLVLASKINGKMDWPNCKVEESELWNETPLVR